jgi:hypothetical protein
VIFVTHTDVLKYFEQALSLLNEGKMDKDFLKNNTYACPSLLVWKEHLLTDDSQMEKKMKRKERRIQQEEAKLKSHIDEAFKLDYKFLVSQKNCA